MKYSIVYSKRSIKDIKKLDKYTQRIIKAWIEINLVNCETPRLHGKALTGDKSGQWRYRIGDYRLLCNIDDDKLVILTLTIGHRCHVYN